MGTQRVQIKVSFLGWFLGLVVPEQDIFVLPFFLTSHYFNSFVPIIAQQAGQAAVLGRLSLSIESLGSILLLVKACLLVKTY